MGAEQETSLFVSNEQRERILRLIFEGYYADAPEGTVVFDTNRSWCSFAWILARLFPEARLICCVRNVAWILDSVERAIRINGIQPSRMFADDIVDNLYSRIQELMNPGRGFVGAALSTLRGA